MFNYIIYILIVSRKKDLTTLVDSCRSVVGSSDRELFFHLIILNSEDEKRTLLNTEISAFQALSRFTDISIKESDRSYFFCNGNLNLRKLVPFEVVTQWCLDNNISSSNDTMGFAFQLLRIVPHKQTGRDPCTPLMAVQNPKWSSSNILEKWVGYPKGLFSDVCTFGDLKCLLDATKRKEIYFQIVDTERKEDGPDSPVKLSTPDRLLSSSRDTRSRKRGFIFTRLAYY